MLNFVPFIMWCKHTAERSISFSAFGGIALLNCHVCNAAICAVEKSGHFDRMRDCRHVPAFLL